MRIFIKKWASFNASRVIFIVFRVNGLRVLVVALIKNSKKNLSKTHFRSGFIRENRLSLEI